MEVSANLKQAVEDYINGNKGAFTTIYNESNRYIYVCINNVMNGNDNKEDMIQDIMQDTYVEISRHIDSLQNINQFLSWAGTIATRKCYEAIKKAGRYVMLNEDESFDNLSDDDNVIPEEIMQNKEKQRLLREIIQNELTEMQKLCIVGYFYNEMKQSEIAGELGIPENSVKSHLLRAKAKIKEAVVDLEKNKGTKLYGVAPLLLLLFTDEVKACTVSPQIGEAVLASVRTGVTADATAVEAAKTAGAVGAKAGVAAVKVKAVIIAAAALVTAGGVAGGIAIAKHSQADKASVKVEKESRTEADRTTEVTENRTEEVTTEATTTEIETTTTEGSMWNGIELAVCGKVYSMPLYAERVIDDSNSEIEEYTVVSMVEGISVTAQEIVVMLADIESMDFNAKIDFADLNTYVCCQLIDKTTGESYKTILQESQNESVVFDRVNDPELVDFDITDYLLYVTYYHDWQWYEGYPGLLFEIPKEEPDDGLKSTLVKAAEKALEDYGYTDALAFSDYNGDGIPEFFALTATAFGNLEGSMYKYENGEYVYYMEIESFGDESSRLYRDKTDGSYIILELDYGYESYTDEDYNILGYYSYNYVYLVDVDANERTLYTTINGDDIMSISQRTFYNEDGTSMTAEEFFAKLDSELSNQYEFVGETDYGYEYYNPDNTPLIAAYNYYLDNR